MKRILMQTYIHGSKQAVELYMRAFDAELGYNVQNDDGAYYHCELNVDGYILAVAETQDDRSQKTGEVMQFCFHYREDEEAKLRKAYDVLSEGATMLLPLSPTDFSPLCADMMIVTAYAGACLYKPCVLS